MLMLRACMIFNITYNERKIENELIELVGKPFGFFDRIKMGGIGTNKLQILEATKTIAKCIEGRSVTNYCYLELRPKGYIVGFQSHLKTYAWAIPFHLLHVYYNGGLLSIYDNKDSVKLGAPFNGKVDKKYLRKILDLKMKYSENLKMREHE